MNAGRETSSELKGLSLIGSAKGSVSTESFTAFDPRTGESIGPDFHSATKDEIERAAVLADEAAYTFARIPKREKSLLLRKIADNLEAISSLLVERASLETGLPVGRFEGELGRTCGQLRMFADIVDEGSWVDARIDRAIPDRKPVPKPDVRSMLKPVGPVAVFCASNFPLAFSVAGGDTASALAAGCPVIVVGHTAHPGTAELAGAAIVRSIREAGLPEGVFSLLFSKGYEAGQALVKHPMINAIAFTGSSGGGKALMDLAANRDRPIPVFAEMSSVNPVFLMPDALSQKTEEIAKGLFESFTLGFGQFCTKPGIVVLARGKDSERFTESLASMAKAQEAFPLLTPGIRDSYVKGSKKRAEQLVAAGDDPSRGFGARTMLFKVSVEDFLKDKTLSDELFGPSTLIVVAETTDDFIKIAERLEGQLTATIHGTDRDVQGASALLDILEKKAGRVVINSFPTGVEVCDSMVHGGPYPATSDSRSTSVGSRAIERFCRLVAFQGFPDERLPAELREGNPLSINRKES